MRYVFGNQWDSNPHCTDHKFIRNLSNDIMNLKFVSKVKYFGTSFWGFYPTLMCGRNCIRDAFACHRWLVKGTGQNSAVSVPVWWHVNRKACAPSNTHSSLHAQLSSFDLSGGAVWACDISSQFSQRARYLKMSNYLLLQEGAFILITAFCVFTKSHSLLKCIIIHCNRRA